MPSSHELRAGDGMLLLDGRPFFPLQFRADEVEGVGWAEVAAIGFNCIRLKVFGAGHDHSVTTAAALPIPPPEELHGLKICGYVWDRVILDDQKTHRAELTAAVQELCAREDVLSYEVYNEPAWRPDAPTAVTITPEQMAQGFDLLKRLDGTGRPVHLGHSASATVEALQSYNRVSDCVGCNPYPVFPKHWKLGERPDNQNRQDLA